MAESIDEDTQVELLRRLERIRRFETRVGELFADNELPGFVHLYLGTEGVAVGTCAPLNDDDYITSTHRGHGHCIAKGLEFKPMMAELYGKETGYCGGKGGSMHIADVTQGMLGANGITASSTPIGGGAALASQIRGNDRVAVSYLGDGATAQGPYHEALHLAATWDLPQVYVIENNHYGEMTNTEVQHPVTDLVKQADAYDIPGVIVNGQDVEEVREATLEAVKRARDGGGPTVIEAKTYRYEGHYEGDPQWYKEDEDLPAWRTADPVEDYRDKLLDEGVLTEAEYEEMTDEIDTNLEAAVEFGRDSPYPDPEAAYEGLYAEEI
jgi:pyruvate dehydrogenase E1 component alpha subunit